MTDLLYSVNVRPLSKKDGGGYLANVPDLQGCMADGDTPEEALTNVRDAIVEWCGEAKRLGREVPAPRSATRRLRELNEQIAKLIVDQEAALKAKDEMLEAQRKIVEQLREELDARDDDLDVPGMNVAMSFHSLWAGGRIVADDDCLGDGSSGAH